MTALVTENLPLLSAAPNGIRQLRELILELAIRGRLLPQYKDDDHAQHLLDRIAAEKVRQGTAGKSSSTSLSTQLDYRLPEGWAAATFEDFALEIATGPFGSLIHQADYVDGGTPLVNPSHMVGNRIVPDPQVALPPDKANELDAYRLRAGDLVMARRGEVGRVALVTEAEDGWLCGTGSFRLRFVEDVSRSYVCFVFRCASVRKYLAGAAVGTTMVNLNHGILKKLPIAIPPVAEQYRIVAKVDELMTLCDRLEAEQADAEAAHAKLVEALLASLTQARDAADFRASWQQLAEHFHTLFTTDESLEALKGAVLQIGVMGRLVPQRTDDGSAADELIRLASSPAMRAVKTKKAQETSDVDAPPFGIPSTWVWTRIGQIAASTEYGLSEKTSHSIEGVPVLKMGDIQRGKVLLETSARVPQGVEGLPELYLEPGDLLYNRTNSAELVGKTGLFLGPGGEYTFASYLIRVRFDAEFVSSAYINHVMNSPLFRETQINPHLKQQCGQANVNGTVMKNMLVSLPPLAEQHRIVAKVDELLGLCDQLKQNLATACQIHEHLASALVEQAVA